MAKTKTKIDWLNHALEFGVVFIGILIAFQLNQCSSNRGQQKLVNDHLESVREETKVNRDVLVNSIEQTKLNISNLDTLTSLLDETDDLSRLNDLTLRLFVVNVAGLRDNAFETFVQTGDIRFVDSYELKSKMFEQYQLYDWVRITDGIALQQYNGYFYPYILKNFDTYNYQAPPMAVFQAKEFRNSIGSYAYFLNRQLWTYESSLEKTETFMERF